MTEEAQPPPPSTSNLDAASGFWARVREHKVIQWGVGYLGAALALAHGAELVSHALHWPDVVWRACVLALIVGFPIALTLAWYHGHRGLQGVSRGELGIISALMLIGAVFLTASLRPDDDRAAAEPEPSALPVRPAIGGSRSANERGDAPKLLAVLPCDSLSTNADDAHFAAGMHLEIISKLNKLRGLSAISRTSVERYAKSDLSIPQIAAELGVSAVIECTARYANDRVKISAQLIDAATDRPLWSDDYDGDLADVFAIQADIGMSIANAVGANFSPAEQAQLERVPTTSPEAYRLYVLSLALVATQSPEGIRQSEVLIGRALDLDPNFARAHTAVAVGLVSNLVDTVAGGPDRMNLPRLEQERQARESAQRALALDPNIGRAHAALAQIMFFEWRWTESLNGFRLAESTERGDPAVTQWSMFFTAYMGDPREGIRIAERGLQLNPNSALGYQTLGIAYGYAHDFDAAVVNLGNAQALVPTSPLISNWLAYMETARGNEAAALAHLKFSERLLGDEVIVAFRSEASYTYHRLGRRDDAERLYRDVEAVAADRELGAGTWAILSLAIGDNDKALEWLGVAAEKARNHEIDAGFYALMNLRMNFTNDPLLNEPRFAEVLKTIRGD